MPNPVGTIATITLPNGDTYVLKDTTYVAATQSTDGLMASTDKTKLDGIEIATTTETATYLGIS